MSIFVDISSFCAYATENLSDSHSYFTVEKTDLHSATDRQRRELCCKIGTVDAGMYLLQRRDEKKACSLGHISLRGGEISHTMQP